MRNSNIFHTWKLNRRNYYMGCTFSYWICLKRHSNDSKFSFMMLLLKNDLPPAHMYWKHMYIYHNFYRHIAQLSSRIYWIQFQHFSGCTCQLVLVQFTATWMYSHALSRPIFLLLFLFFHTGKYYFHMRRICTYNHKTALLSWWIVSDDEIKP